MKALTVFIVLVMAWWVGECVRQYRQSEFRREHFRTPAPALREEPTPRVHLN